MSKETKKNLPASVRQKLLNNAHANAEDFQFVLDRYALERFMYRLSFSPHKDIFVVKGAMLFSIWSTERYGVTRDLDLSQQLAKTIPEILGLFRDVLQTKTPEDGITFNAKSLRGEQIREGHPEGGVRITLTATIERAKASLQIDIGFTQEVWPEPKKRLFPSSLGLPAPELLAYPVEAMVAEKFEAMICLAWRTAA